MSSHTFNAFDLHSQILTNVSTLGFATPTPIQKESIPPILSGEDLIGLAQTGTGKTAAFLLPIIHRLMPGTRGKLRALILVPTRELAQQIHDAFVVFAKELKLRSIAVYGGVNINQQKDRLRRGAEVLVACPGRLLDLMRQRCVDLSAIETLVLDEADHMFDIGFLPDVRQIMQQLPTKRQSLLFSATMPKDVRQLANDILKNPKTVQINHAAPVKTITQALYPVSQNLKTELLIKLLQTLHVYSAIVFTRTKHGAKRVADQLEKAGYSSTSLQGNLSQAKRQRAMSDFKSGKLQILVATDIASRGIDVASITHVFNYDMPDTVEKYTHRIGRTGRAAKTGSAFTLVTREDTSKLRNLERVLKMKIEQRFLPDFDYKKKAAELGHTDSESHQHPAKKAFVKPHKNQSSNKNPAKAFKRNRQDNRSESERREGKQEKHTKFKGKSAKFTRSPDNRFKTDKKAPHHGFKNSSRKKSSAGNNPHGRARTI